MLKILWKSIVVMAVLVTTSALADQSQNGQFKKLADTYIDTLYLPANPSKATVLGVHDYDAILEDVSFTGINQRISALQQFAKRVEAINPAQLDEQTQGDRELVLSNIRSQLLTLQKIRPWEKNPDFYSSAITRAAFVIVERNFAPADERLKSLIAREKLMPAALSEARKNLKNPPKIYTDIAIEQIPGQISFFEKDVPAAFASVTDPVLKQQFTETNAAVVNALKDYQRWLTAHLLPRSKGDFRIGAENYRKKLQYDEMVDIPLSRLLVIGWSDLKKNQRAYKRLVWELSRQDGASRSLDLAKLAGHPAPDELLSTFSSSFDSLIGFINDKKIITIPSDVRPTMEETPPFIRAITFASMDTPGPFETKAQEAYLNVTLPDPSWSKARVNNYLIAFNYPAIRDIAIHETYPGHYVQFLWVRQQPNRVRKILGARSNSEGWAHYCEQMMLEEGYAQSGDSRQAKLMRLGQLQNALLRNARFIVGIKMHAGKMTFDQAVDFFVKQGYQSKSTGLIETKRGTSDPTYLYYTLGKLQILKLRADLKAIEKKEFNLQQFHDAFMQQGFPPIKIVRKAMLHNDSPTL